jgi:hypothetical protein
MLHYIMLYLNNLQLRPCILRAVSCTAHCAAFVVARLDISVSRHMAWTAIAASIYSDAR